MPKPGVMVMVILGEIKPCVQLGYVEQGFWHLSGSFEPYSGVIRYWMTVEDTKKAMMGFWEAPPSAVPNMPNIPPPPARKIGTGAEALAMEQAAQDPDEPCRVRRVFDGKYLAWDDTGGRGTYTFDAESVWPRSRATVIANAMIVLTGEHDIEVEPVNG
jgi:hypothetical protein